ncbi:MAG TPA: TlpA family protein disulfide reductase [Actinobacteria bacterium]|nr:TlpA family protein disulfide reductase [Actinomycetota bacterium]
MSEEQDKNAGHAVPVEPEEAWQARDIIIALIAFAVIIAVAVGGFFIYQAEKTPPLMEGDMAPDFTLQTLDGGQISLSDLRGKVVLVNIWATWCNPCREEMPYMERQYQNLKDQPFEILAVSQDRLGETEVEPFVKEYGLTFPILLDPDKNVGGLFQSSKFPESFIIDKDGVIVERVVGQLGPSNFQLIQHLVDN